ncbi:MAG: hypothetical protein N0E54_15725 [Candidatus Thiodiazotropha taylori]|nr:hypothetical protein [Candidatus Thiodiazotropha taylori]
MRVEREAFIAGPPAQGVPDDLEAVIIAFIVPAQRRLEIVAQDLGYQPITRTIDATHLHSRLVELVIELAAKGGCHKTRRSLQKASSPHGIPTPSSSKQQIGSIDPSLPHNHEIYTICQTSGKDDKLLTTGPSSECLECIDNAPATNAHYRPIDQIDSSLLTQDGAAPFIGDSRFHQQTIDMAALRTNRNEVLTPESQDAGLAEVVFTTLKHFQSKRDSEES